MSAAPATDRAAAGPEVEERPHAPGLSVIAVMLAILGAGMLPTNVVKAAGAAEFGPVAVALGVLMVIFAVAMVVGAVGLWMRKRWARPVVTVVALLALLSLVSILASVPFGPEWILPLMLAFALASILVYLQKPHVVAALG